MREVTPASGPVVTVFVPTFRRPQLLARAIESLISQSYQDWECFVINDDPEDSSVSQLLSGLHDERIQLIQHQTNSGAFNTFNEIFSGDLGSGKYLSLLEDDNRWEPEFLRRMVFALDSRSDIDVGWANMFLIDEMPEGQLSEIRGTVWPLARSSFAEPEEINWPTARSAFGAMHSNGAMLLRRSSLGSLVLPQCCDFAAVEILRERAFRFPILFIREPLAAFTRTIVTARSLDPISWSQMQLLVLASFIRTALDSHIDESVWRKRLTVAEERLVVIACHWLGEHRLAFRWASIHSYFFWAAYFLRHPLRMLRLLRVMRERRMTWEYLINHTGEQWKRFLSSDR